jgi:hypothetical protein
VTRRQMDAVIKRLRREGDERHGLLSLADHTPGPDKPCVRRSDAERQASAA